MKRGKVLKSKLRRARWRLKQALQSRSTTRARKRQARRTVSFWEDKLTRFRKNRRLAKLSGRRWGGSRQVTNEIIRIVDGRAPITSRKRWELFGNPGSDHYRGNKSADAVDFGIDSAFWLAEEIARKLGGSWDGDYDSFTVVRGNKQFRVQLIAGTHGTGPHLHTGVARI